jgi:hypothetical protein
MGDLTNIISFWGGEEGFYFITKQTMPQNVVKTIVDKYNNEAGALGLCSSHFTDVNSSQFQLWIDGQVVGLLSIDLSPSWEGESDESPYVHIGINSVFILEEFRHKGWGTQLSNVVSNYLANELMNNMLLQTSLTKSEIITIHLYAELMSEAGETFVENTSTSFDEESPFMQIMKHAGFKMSLQIDADY